MEIKSKEKLPFLFKDFTEGFISENPNIFTSKDASFKQSLTEKQFNILKKFDVNKKAEEIEKAEEINEIPNSAKAVDGVKIEDDKAKAEIALLKNQAAKMIKNSNPRKKLERRIKELEGILAQGKK